MTALSPAQLQERRDAARARWDKAKQAALLAAGGAAGGLAAAQIPESVTRTRVHRLARYLTARKLTPERLEPVAERWLLPRTLRRVARVDAAREVREQSIRRGFTKPLAQEAPAKPSLLGLHARKLRRDIARDHVEINRLKAAVQSAVDPAEADRLIELGGVRVENQAKRRAALAELYHLLPAEYRRRAGAFPERQADHWYVRLHNGEIVEAAAQPGARAIRRPHRVRVHPSDLERDEAKQIRTGLRTHADQVANRVKDHILATASRDMPEAREDVRYRYVRMAQRQLKAAIRPIVRRGIIGAGISAGLLAGAFAAARLSPSENSRFLQTKELAKADPGDSDDPVMPTPRRTRSTARRLVEGADNIEQELAAGVARALASWKDAVTPQSIASPNAQGGLFDQLEAPLMTGMAPLDHATAAGLTAPSRLQPPADEEAESKPKPKLLHFGFDIRDAAVKRYAQQYRYNRVREISDAQRKNIREIIIDATNRADPPAVIARKIRDVVGLTAYQAQIVANYRQVLEAGDPRSLTYSLRDKRFDPTIKAAIKDKKPLTVDQVDKMVDTYQRRMIASRSMTIARTEALRAANNGHIKTIADFLEANPEYTVAKTWISTEDEKTRPDHVGLHRQTVIGLQTPFICESGEKIRWPHDPSAAAKEVIRCRCTLLTSLMPRNAAARHGPAAYGTPTPNFWQGPRQPFNIDSPDDLFGPPSFEPA